MLQFDIVIFNNIKKNVHLEALELTMSYHCPLEVLSVKKLLDILI